MRPTLVVVHVDLICLETAAQNRVSVDRFLSEVEREIHHAQQRRQPIVPLALLQFTDARQAVDALLRHEVIPDSWTIPGVIHPRVSSLLLGYDLAPKEALQTFSDGSAEVAACCSKNGYSTDAFALIGLFREACVEQTKRGLLSRFPHSSVRVLRNACIGINDSAELTPRA